MTWNPLTLKGLSFINPNGDPAFLEFQSGLNVVCGASDTGKSFIVEAINFLLGSQEILRDIPERVGYDRARLVLQTLAHEEFTLERSVAGGAFSRFEGNQLLSNSELESITILREKHAHGKLETLSVYLLSIIGLMDKYVLKNKDGDTNSLSFRNLVKMVVIQENDITKRISPILSGQSVQKTSEYSVFKLLLTGVDDSSLKSHAKIQAEMVAARQNNAAKIEFIDELLEELQIELNGIGVNRVDAENQLLQLQAYSETQQEILNQKRQELDIRIDRRYNVARQIQTLSNRIDEIGGLLLRFDLLKKHYQIDINRLAAIEESGSLFVHLERLTCPLCGAPPDEEHQVEACDGDIVSIINAAIAETAKVEKLLVELEQTILDLSNEVENLASEKEQLVPEFQKLNREIEEITSPLKEAQNTFSEIFSQSNAVRRIIESFDRVTQLQEKKAVLNAEVVNSKKPVSLTVDLSTSVLFDFARKVQDLLHAWNFPGLQQVHFDESTKDIVIGGQPRTSRGKGLRAITHAAMTIGLMEFCKERNLSHPGFVVLDSPLLAYYKPESSEDSLVGSDLKLRFYEYLANNHIDSQVIIIENEHPPIAIEQRIAFTTFTKSNEGRYGFFPPQL